MSQDCFSSVLSISLLNPPLRSRFLVVVYWSCCKNLPPQGQLMLALLHRRVCVTFEQPSLSLWLKRLLKNAALCGQDANVTAKNTTSRVHVNTKGFSDTHNTNIHKHLEALDKLVVRSRRSGQTCRDILSFFINPLLCSAVYEILFLTKAVNRAASDTHLYTPIHTDTNLHTPIHTDTSQ